MKLRGVLLEVPGTNDLIDFHAGNGFAGVSEPLLRKLLQSSGWSTSEEGHRPERDCKKDGGARDESWGAFWSTQRLLASAFNGRPDPSITHPGHG